MRRRLKQSGLLFALTLHRIVNHFLYYQTTATLLFRNALSESSSRVRVTGAPNQRRERLRLLIILQKARVEDREASLRGEESHHLQDIVNHERLSSSFRARHYHLSRQLLILYSLVASAPTSSLD